MTVSPATGGSTTFNPPTAYDADTYYDVTLSATDSKGHVGSKTVRIDPQTVAITLASVPAGAPLTYVSQPAAAAPFTKTVAIGYAMLLGATDQFTKNGATYVFVKWSDSGALSHYVTAPETATTYTATYDGLPTASGKSDKTVGLLPLTVNFDGSGSSDPDAGDALTYDWDFGDGTAHGTGAKPTHSYTTAGKYTPKLTVKDGSGQTAGATLATITAGDTAPTATITAPATGTLFNAGASVPLSGTASDAEDGTLSGSSLTWQVTLHNDTTTQALPATSGPTATLAIPANATVDGWYDIAFTATDSLGVATTKNVRIDPRVSTVALASDPAGVALTWNGTALSSVAAVVGSHGTIGAPDSATSGGHSWLFTEVVRRRRAGARPDRRGRQPDADRDLRPAAGPVAAGGADDSDRADHADGADDSDDPERAGRAGHAADRRPAVLQERPADDQERRHPDPAAQPQRTRRDRLDRPALRVEAQDRQLEGEGHHARQAGVHRRSGKPTHDGAQAVEGSSAASS